MTEYDCVVVGAGVLGSSTAYQLAKDGHNVLLLEQFSLPHSRGSSHGAVRILRFPYADIRHQVAMPEQYHMWHQLEKEANTVLTHPMPMLLLAPSRNEVFTNKFNVTRKSGLACSELSEAQMKDAYPLLNFPGCAASVQDEFLVIDAHKAVQCLQNEFVKKGGTLRDNEKVLKIDPGPVVTIHTERGGQYRAKGVVLTPGPWASSMLKPLGLDLPLKVWRVNVCYFKEKLQGSHSNLPFVYYHVDKNDHDDLEKVLVAFPSREYPGMVKVNYHLLWNSVDPDNREKGSETRQVDIEGMKAFVKTHLPGLDSVPAVIEPCLYTCTPKEEAIVGTHPLYSNIAIGCSMSGKGFKMAPLVGRVLGEMALGKPPSFDTSLISINRYLSDNKSKL